MNDDEPEDPIDASPTELELRLRDASLAHEAGVPRRFGMGTLMLITAMYAVLFAVLRAFELAPFAFVKVVLFFTAVGLGQMLLFKGEHPRRASFIVGATFFAVWMLIQVRPSELVNFEPIGWLCFFFLVLTCYGGFLGYFCGAIIAAVFLLIDKCKARLAAVRRTGGQD